MTGSKFTIIDHNDGVVRSHREPPGGRPGMQSETTPLQVLMRRKWTILTIAVLATAAAAAVVVQLPVRYAATVSIVVDPRQPRVISAESLMSTQTPDPLLLRTRMEELRSPQIARAVVTQLGLNRVEEFCNPPRSVFARLLTRVGLARPETESEAEARSTPGQGCNVPVAVATTRLMRNVSGSADGRSFVIWVRAEAADPQLAAAIANAYGTVFVERRRYEMQELAQQARTWLTNNASELREKMQEAASALEEYRAQHRLATMRGETLAALSLTDVNGQLTATQGDLAAKRATLEQLTRFVQGGGDIEASTLAQSLPSMHLLVEQYGQLQTTYAQLQARLGRSHPDLQEAAARVERSRQLLRSVAGKGIAALSNDVRALEARRASLQDQVHTLQTELDEQGQAEVRLRDLEREANLTRELYGTLLTRLSQIEAEQSLQVADVRLAVEAQVPEQPFAPRTKMVLVGVFLAALGAAAMLMLARDLLSRIFRDTEQIEEQTGLPVLGLFPAPPRGLEPQAVVTRDAGSAEAEAVHGVLANLTSRHFDLTESPAQILLVTSALPGEGKSSFAVALGRAAAQAGLKTLVIDCDLRRPSIARIAALPEPPAGQEVARAGTAPLFGEPVLDRASKLHVLPLSGPIANPHEALASARLPKIIARLREVYDVVILDTPPVLAAVDALNLTRLADDIVVVVGWRKATRAAVVATLRALHRNGARSMGIVLSKVDLRRYARDVGDERWAKAYRDYRAPVKLQA